MEFSFANEIINFNVTFPLTFKSPYDKLCIVEKRRVAQFGRALRSGRRGRKFESCHADDSKDSGMSCERILGRGKVKDTFA